MKKNIETIPSPRHLDNLLADGQGWKHAARLGATPLPLRAHLAPGFNVGNVGSIGKTRREEWRETKIKMSEDNNMIFSDYDIS